MPRNRVSASLSTRQTHNFSEKPGFFQASFSIKVFPKALASTAFADQCAKHSQGEQRRNEQPPVVKLNHLDPHCRKREPS